MLWNLWDLTNFYKLLQSCHNIEKYVCVRVCWLLYIFLPLVPKLLKLLTCQICGSHCCDDWWRHSSAFCHRVVEYNVLMCRMHVLPPHSLLQAINQHNFARLSNGSCIARRVSHIWIWLAVLGLERFHCLPYTQVILSSLQNAIKFTSQNKSRILAMVDGAIGNITMTIIIIKSLMVAINLCINKNCQ